MDSITQFVLGASVGLAVSPQKTPKVAIISGVIATMPDLDILINYGNDLDNMINHRSFTHSFFVLSLFCLPLSLLLKKIFAKLDISLWHWFLLSFFVLNTHILLDALTIFGTQIFWPLNTPSIMIGSMFIFDIFYTTPLLIVFILLLKKRKIPKIYSISSNTIALSVSSAYLLLALILQQYVFAVNKPPIPSANIINSFTMPTPSNLVIWRSVFIDTKNSYENFYNLFTNSSKWQITPLNKNKYNINSKNIDKYNRFSHGFYRLENTDNNLVIKDLRMGTTKMPIFGFSIADKKDNKYQAIQPSSVKLSNFSFRGMFGD